MIAAAWLINGVDDLADVTRIYKTVFIEEQSLAEARHDVKHMGEQAHFLVVYEGEKAIGTGCLCLDGERFVLKKIAVLKPYRKTGIGDFMMRLLIRRAYEMGGSRQWLVANEATRGFYEKFGFVPAAGTFECLDESCVCMVRDGDISGHC